MPTLVDNKMTLNHPSLGLINEIINIVVDGITVVQGGGGVVISKTDISEGITKDYFSISLSICYTLYIHMHTIYAM